MEPFPHLNFLQKITGPPRLFGSGEPNEKSLKNREDKQAHRSFLFEKTDQIKTDWRNSLADRETNGLAEIDSNVIPIFIQINPDLLIDLTFNLQTFGIEIISEEDNGFIIGASLDNLKALQEKIDGFITNKFGSGKIADFWNITTGDRMLWKPQHILSEELFRKWPEIQDDEVLKLEIGVAFDKPMTKEPDPGKQGGKLRLEKYRRRQIERDNAWNERQEHFAGFIRNYGQVISSYIDLEDSFSCEVEISGKGLKDLVMNYQFVFEVNEVEEIGGIDGTHSEAGEMELEILAPDDNAPIVGVIDSGIMEGHKYLELAIDGKSKSYIEGDVFTSDKVLAGGHGTRVAGAILYPQGISQIASPYQLPFFIRNLRVLNDVNNLIHKYPPELIKQIVIENADCKIFNMSINSKIAFRKKHMSTWGAVIDTLINENNILFLISSGNLQRATIKDFIDKGQTYPTYFQEAYCKLANPAQSCFALCVGSVNHSTFEDDYWKSLGNKDDISAFSRIGTGIWNTIKPDVVEYGGGLVISKNGLNQIKEHKETAPELIRSTYNNTGGAYGKDAVGTSFSTPKVAHIAAKLKTLYPNEDVNLIRALIVQGARLPNEHFRNPTEKSIQHFGYGLPSIDRVTTNTEHRVTFYNTGKIKAEEGHIYVLQIPEDLRNQGNEYEILIEVTLAYTAKVRRTRQKINSYLSSWLDWTTSKLGESSAKFKEYALKEIDEVETNYDKKQRQEFETLKWKIDKRSDRGEVLNINRNYTTIQKDWTIVNSYLLSEEISFAVRGHKGWDKNQEEVPYALTVSIEILGANIPIYESIRIANEVEISV